MILRFLVFLPLVLCFQNTAFAFPETITHGYQNCMACHISPTGGGALNAYGRSLSLELMSDFGSESETKIGHGLIPDSPEWLIAGGDFRWIQTHVNNDEVIENRFFRMQTQIELGARKDNTWFSVSGRQVSGPPDTKDLDKTKLAGYQLGYQYENWIFRLGLLRIPFGWMNANHTLITERPLGFDQGKESESLEAMYVAEKWDILLSAGQGNPNETDTNKKEKIQTATASWAITESSKLGASVLNGKMGTRDRLLTGVFGITPITEKTAYMAELNYQTARTEGQAARNGWYGYQELIFYPTKGLKTYFQTQYLLADIGNPGTQYDSHGIGARWMPRPHFVFEAFGAKQRNRSLNEHYTDQAWVLLHYYL